MSIISNPNASAEFGAMKYLLYIFVSIGTIRLNTFVQRFGYLNKRNRCVIYVILNLIIGFTKKYVYATNMDFP